MFIALVIAADWVLGMGVYAAELATGGAFPFAYPLIDAMAVVALLMRFPTPETRGRALAVFIVAILVLQQTTRLGLTPQGLHWTIMLVINRLFDVILLSLWAVSLARIIRLYFPGLWTRLRGGAGPPKLERSYAAGAPLGPIGRRIYNIMVEIHNTEIPPEEHLPLAEKPEATPKGAVTIPVKKDV